MIKETFSTEIEFINFVAPFKDAVDRNRKLSKNFTLGEFYDATYMLKDEWDGVTSIPLHVNAVEVSQYLRDLTGSSITPTSAFRTVAHEISKKRSGNSQHTEALAIDLAGNGLPELMLNAIETKNHIFQKLRSLGVNGFGVYNTSDDYFIHLDFRQPKLDGGFYYWNDLKKKGDLQIKNQDLNTDSNYLKYLPILIFLIIIWKPLTRIFIIRNRYKMFKSKFITTGNKYD